MSFLAEFTLTEAPVASATSKAKADPVQANRKALVDAVTAQIGYAKVKQGGGEPMIGDGEKQTKPRLFWTEVAGKILFMPKFSAKPVFGEGKGVAAPDYDALISLMERFSAAVETGEFDGRMAEIIEEKAKARAASKVGAPAAASSGAQATESDAAATSATGGADNASLGQAA